MRTVARSCAAAVAVCALSLLVLTVNGADSRTAVMRVTSGPPNTCLTPLTGASDAALCLDDSHTQHLWLGRLSIQGCAEVTYVGSHINGATVRSTRPTPCGAR